MSQDFFTMFTTMVFDQIENFSYMEEPIAEFNSSGKYVSLNYNEMVDFLKRGKQLGLDGERFNVPLKELEHHHKIFTRLLPPDNIPYAY